MKFKKSIRTYCRRCKKHTVQKVSQEKQSGRNKTHPMSHGSRKRMRRRGLDRGYGNQGRTSKGAVSSFKRSGAKSSKVITIKGVVSATGANGVGSDMGSEIYLNLQNKNFSASGQTSKDINIEALIEAKNKINLIL